MNSSLSPQPVQGACTAEDSFSAASAVECQTGLTTAVSESAQEGIDDLCGAATRYARPMRFRRARFILRALYWTLRHRSLSRGVWVANYEGYSWN